MRARFPRILASALAAASASPAAAQTQQRVLPGVEDVSPLRKIEDDLYRDLRTPVGWDAVYRVPVKDAQGNVKWMYARRSGALTALFPLSVYNVSRDGVEIAVPPGTVFHLGPIDSALRDGSATGEATPPSSGTQASSTTATPAKPLPMCVMEHEPYRQARMRQLLTEAVSAPASRRAEVR